jgi:hypothetical protein
VDTISRAIEMTGTIDERRQLHLDEQLPVAGPSRVRVIILLSQELDADERDWLRAASANPAFEFLKDPKEDIYSLSDGRPYRAEG